ncbi:hypothetical protein HYC85_009172 [Camellia sinensis]|uniref:shikimate kinase n=1 Tax=Camellia sinensis TaxID=4442 RepID=A0A7J7HGX0_CAMSI|nr:hypothetical protein HYC85_009172 [Camellia sinensis]
MEATCGTTLQFASPWIGSEKIEGRLNGFLRVSQRRRKDYRLKSIHFTEFQWRTESTPRRRVSSSVSHPCNDSQAPAPQSGNFHSFDENWLLKRKGEEVASYLNGRCIFLVGMMGSGKTTVGKILSEALAYSFVDSDKYVEESLGGSTVAQIFKKFGESFFRDYESEALRNLSLMPRQVVATGGGVVIRPINWEYMKEGVTVYLDVPLDALARRIAAVGTGSRPLLDFDSGDAYTKAFMGLFTLSKKREHAYASADATVSLQYIAADLGLDISDITPTAIALEVLVQIENFLQRNNGMSIQMFP